MSTSMSGPLYQSEPSASACAASPDAPHVWAHPRTDADIPSAGPSSLTSSHPTSPTFAYTPMDDVQNDSYTRDDISLAVADISSGTHVESSMLTSPTSSRPPLRRSPLSPASNAHLSPLHSPALFPYQNTNHNTRRENVVPFLVNELPSSDYRGSQYQHGYLRTQPVESHLSTSNPSQHVSISSLSHRPPTDPPVFSTASALAAHHGIPQSLPPIPRTTKYSSASSSVPAPVSAPGPSAPQPEPSEIDWSALCSDYLSMLQQNSADSTSGNPNTPAVDMFDDAGIRAVMDVLQASPIFQDPSEFLTSPFEDSPLDDFLTTPALGGSDFDLTSPAIADADDFDNFGTSAPLFGGGDALGLNVPRLSAFKDATTSAPQGPTCSSLDFDTMYTMPSPPTPALDPSSLHPSPRQTVASSLSTPSIGPGRRKNGPTGTRKNIMPEALVPLDAPIQQRKYITPSATSRKDVPAVFAKKKRSLSQAFGDEEEIALDPNDVDAIEAKRRQNTLAARRSRKRKLEYQRELEAGMEREKEEKEMWRSRAQLCEALLRSHGFEVPQFES